MFSKTPLGSLPILKMTEWLQSKSSERLLDNEGATNVGLWLTNLEWVEPLKVFLLNGGSIPKSNYTYKL